MRAACVGHEVSKRQALLHNIPNERPHERFCASSIGAHTPATAKCCKCILQTALRPSHAVRKAHLTYLQTNPLVALICAISNRSLPARTHTHTQERHAMRCVLCKAPRSDTRLSLFSALSIVLSVCCGSFHTRGNKVFHVLLHTSSTVLLRVLETCAIGEKYCFATDERLPGGRRIHSCSKRETGPRGSCTFSRFQNPP